MNVEICPVCSQPRAWSGWRQCPCGYDFGPGRRQAPATPPPLPTPAELLQRQRDQDFTVRIVVLGLILLTFGLAVYVAFSLPGNPRLIGTVERSFGPVIPASVHVDSLRSEDPETVMSGLYWLSERRSSAGVNLAIDLLQSPDDYIWLNAAHYLGVCERQESVPYLIKALRHTAWRSDPERVQMLQKLTQENFGNDFERWQQWWMKGHPNSAIDWESHLGFRPRLEKRQTVSSIFDEAAAARPR